MKMVLEKVNQELQNLCMHVTTMALQL